MRLLFLLLLFSLPAQSRAQTSKSRTYSPFDFKADSSQSRYVSFAGDTTTNKSNLYDKALDSQYCLDKNYDFEFRLWKYHLTNNFDNVFILTLKNNKWTARYFDRNNGIKGGTIFTERAVDQSKVNQLWMRLVENNVLTLPTQRALEDRMTSYVVDTANLEYGSIRKVDITDGILYCFELLTPTKKKIYSYGCPNVYLGSS